MPSTGMLFNYFLPAMNKIIYEHLCISSTFVVPSFLFMKLRFCRNPMQKDRLFAKSFKTWFDCRVWINPTFKSDFFSKV